jgi:peptidoglycan/LPS O-acetylase OafA/YrhL
MTETQQGAPTGRFIALDSLRGLVALAIVFFHMGNFGWIAGLTPLRSGWMLVEFFFVLSGFVIAASYGQRLAHGYPRWRFMLIRLGRVYPLHIVTVALFVAARAAWSSVRCCTKFHPWSVLPRAVFLLDAFRTQTGDFYAPVSWAVGSSWCSMSFAAALFGRGRWALAIAVALAGASAWALYSGFNVSASAGCSSADCSPFPVGVACYWLHQRLRQGRARHGWAEPGRRRAARRAGVGPGAAGQEQRLAYRPRRAVRGDGAGVRARRRDRQPRAAVEAAGHARPALVRALHGPPVLRDPAQPLPAAPVRGDGHADWVRPAGTRSATRASIRRRGSRR